MNTPADLRWEQRMSEKEIEWCYRQIEQEIQLNEHCCADSFRAAKVWKRTQIKRFKKCRTCCGCYEWIAYRWNWKKLRFDKYILGYNWGH